MNAYMTEEEQVEAIKKWWAKYGNHLMTAILCVLLIVAAVHWYQRHDYSVKSQASAGFEQLMRHFADGDKSGVSAQANYLISHYPNTVYASGASLILAKEAVNIGQYGEAKKQLNLLLKHSNSHALRQIARLRLSRILLRDKQYKDALKVLGKVEDKAFLGAIYEVKGDVYFNRGENQKAHAQYQLALKKLPNIRLASPELKMKFNQVSSNDVKVLTRDGQKEKQVS